MGPISFNGGVTGLPLGDFLLGKVFEFREATPFRQDITQGYIALYGQDTWRVSPNITMNYGCAGNRGSRRTATTAPSTRFGRPDEGRHPQHSLPERPGGSLLSRRPGLPWEDGHEDGVDEPQSARRRLLGSEGDGRTSVRAGYGLTGDFVTGQFFFDSKSAPPFGLEQRLTGTSFDDPWGAVGRTNPYPVSTLYSPNFPFAQDLYALFVTVPYDIKTTRNHSLERRAAAAGGRQHGVCCDLPRQPHGQRVGHGRQQPALVTRLVRQRRRRAPRTCRARHRRRSPTANASLDQRREFSLLNPAVGQFYGYLDTITDAGWQDIPGRLMSRAAPIGRRHHDQRQLHHLALRGPDQPGWWSAERRDGLHEAGVAPQSAFRG
jgi:hypothetical protein